MSVIDVDSRSEWARVPVGEGPGGIDVDRATGLIYVVNSGSNDITIIEDRMTEPPTGPPAEAASPWVGRPLPDFSLSDLDGRVHNRADLLGRNRKLYILNFFASW